MTSKGCHVQGLITKKYIAIHTNYFKMALYCSALVMKLLTIVESYCEAES